MLAQPTQQRIAFSNLQGVSCASRQSTHLTPQHRDNPLHLMDGSTGKKRASYPIINHTERFVGPHSIVFSPDCTQLYCGHENAIEIFDFSRDGAAGRRIKTTSARKTKDGQKGIVSDLSISPSSPNLLAAASYSRTCGIYDISGGVEAVQLFSDQGSGVSQVAFHRDKPELFTASRQSDAINRWDLRYAATPMTTYERPGRTNQRLRFDMDQQSKHLLAGDMHGNLHVFNLQDQDPKVHSATPSLKLESDAIGSVQLHPTYPYLLTAWGSRKFNVASDSSDSDSEVDGSESGQQMGSTATAPNGGLTVWHLPLDDHSHPTAGQRPDQ